MPGESTSILSTSLNTTDNIELRYNQNFLCFSFTTLAAILGEQLDEKKRLGQYAWSIFQNANRLQRIG
jgi:hypothetical protein